MLFRLKIQAFSILNLLFSILFIYKNFILSTSFPKNRFSTRKFRSFCLAIYSIWSALISISFRNNTLRIPARTNFYLFTNSKPYNKVLHTDGVVGTYKFLRLIVLTLFYKSIYCPLSSYLQTTNCL